MHGDLSYCYLVFKGDGSGQFPMYRTTEDKVALMLFKSRQSAQAFIDGKGMTSEWAVQELSQTRFSEWSREAVKRYGASELAIDSDPTTSDIAASVIPLLAFLIELEGTNPN